MEGKGGGAKRGGAETSKKKNICEAGLRVKIHRTGSTTGGATVRQKGPQKGPKKKRLQRSAPPDGKDAGLPL